MSKTNILTDLILEIKDKKTKVSASAIRNYIKLDLKLTNQAEIAKEIKSINEKVYQEFKNSSILKLDNAEELLKEQLELINKILKYKNTARNDFLMPFIVMIFIIPIVYVFVTPSEEEIIEANKIQKEKDQIGTVGGAWAYTQMYVEKQLKNPSSADFPLTGIRNVTHVSNGLYMFKSYVDAQNSFGATTRTYFEGTIQRVNGGWEIVTFKFLK